MLKIGRLKLASNVLLAPLAGISDASFRLLNRRRGATFTFVEMINARAISHKNKKTARMLTTQAQDKPIGVQLLGCEIPHLLEALEIIENYPFDLLDFNAACPVKKVCRRGEGAALLKDPKTLETILKALVKRSTRPVTIKIRSGWDQHTHNAPAIARLAQEAGVEAVFIHGRDRNQFYKGQADWRIIAQTKKNVRIPVIGSGDIFSAQDAGRMLEETGCDGVLVARGALGNPWIFKEIHAQLNNQPLPAKPSAQEIKATLLEHIDLSIAEHGEKNAIKVMRKYVGWYLKGHKHIRALRQQASTLKTKEELLLLLKSVC